MSNLKILQSNDTILNLTKTKYCQDHSEFYSNVDFASYELYLLPNGNADAPSLYLFRTPHWQIADAFGCITREETDDPFIFVGRVDHEIILDLVMRWSRDLGVMPNRKQIFMSRVLKLQPQDENAKIWTTFLRAYACEDNCKHIDCPMTKDVNFGKLRSMDDEVRDFSLQMFSAMTTMLSGLNLMDEHEIGIALGVRNAVARNPIVRYLIVHVPKDKLLQGYVSWARSFINWQPGDDMPVIYIPQGGGPSHVLGENSQAWFSITEWIAMTRLKDKFWDTHEACVKWIEARLTGMIQLMAETLTMFVPDMADCFIDRIVYRIREFIGILYKTSLTLISKAFVAAFFTLIVVSTCTFISIISKKLFIFVIGALGFSLNEFEPQAGSEPNLLSIILIGLIGFLGLRKDDAKMKRIVAIAKPLTLMVTVGAIGGSIVRQILALLPTTLNCAILYATGSTEEIMNYNIDSWIGMATIVNQLSKQSKYLASPFYQQLFDTVYRSGRALLADKSLTTKQRDKMMPLYVRLMSLSAVIEGFRNVESVRTMPFYIHIAGAPGCGKTTIASHLLKKLFAGDIEKEVYWRPPNDFWDGYHAQKFIIYDEFLVGSAQYQERFLNEMLQLVSSARFITNCASLGPSLAGVKGTLAEPLSVISMNNDVYPRVAGFTDEQVGALHRRRHFVLHMTVKAEYMNNGQRNVDLSDLTDEQLSKFHWVDFRIVESNHVFGRAVADYPALSYDEMIERMTVAFRSYERMCRQLAVVTGAEAPPMDEVKDSITAMLVSAPCFVQKPPTLGQLLRDGYDWMKSAFVSQGGSRRFRKKKSVKLPPIEEVQSTSSGPLASAIYSEYCEYDSEELDEEVVFPLSDYKNGRLVSSEINWPELSYESTEPFWSGLVFTKWILVGTTFVVSLWTIKRYLFESSEEEDREFSWEVQSSAPPQHIRKNEPRNRPNVVRGLRTWEPQARSPFYVRLSVLGREAWAVPIGRRRFLAFAHIFMDTSTDIIADEFDVCIRHKGVIYSAKVKEADMASIPSSDLVLFDLKDQHLPYFPNIEKYFWTEKHLNEFSSGRVLLDGVTPISTTARKVANSRSYSMPRHSFLINQPIITNMNTVRGDCGRPLICSYGSCSGLIMGIHTAGSMIDHVGLVVPVTAEDVSSLINALEGLDPQSLDLAEVSSYDNCIAIETIPEHMRVHLGRKSKLEPSCLTPLLPWSPLKRPAFLAKEDPDPVEVAIKNTLDHTEVPVDEDLVKSVFADMLNNYDHSLFADFPWRELTFEEACGGIPGLLSSLRIQTSSGWPLVKIAHKPGKQDFVWFDEKGVLGYSDAFEDMVDDFIGKVRAGHTPEAVYLGYLKDELVSVQKYNDHNTRIIYASSVIATVAFRMLYGAVLVKFQNSYDKTPLAIGINQYSYDMDIVYNYLIAMGSNMVAGDYSKFDRRFHSVFRDQAYVLLGNLLTAVPLFSWAAFDAFHRHETQAVAQMENYRFQPRSLHFSGCFFTTIINCLVNEAYIRYVFARAYPRYFFDECVRLKVLGDDHLLAVRDGIEFSGPIIQNGMKEIGQVYTAPDKTANIPRFQQFHEVTFLGAHPRLLRGKWTGAAKKATLEEAVLWTRDKDTSINDTARQMIELASQWDKEYYERYRDNVLEALQINGFIDVEKVPWETMSRVVALRTAGSDENYGFIPQVKEGEEGVTNTGVVAGLTTFHGLQGHMVTTPGSLDTRDKVLNERVFDFGYCTDTKMFRDQFSWTVSGAAGTLLKTYDLPFEILTFGEQNNIQNLPFDRLIYWRGQVEITFQINANPFSQGYLCVFFYPLGNPPATIDLAQWTQYQHVNLTPNSNPTATLCIPYRFPRLRMNTFTRDQAQPESLGRLFVGIFSPLLNNDNSAITVTMYSRFPESEFTIPRPISASERLIREYKRSGKYQEAMKRVVVRGLGGRRDHDLEAEIREDGFEPQGQSGSRVVNNTVNKYNVGDVAGNMPIQVDSSAAGNSQTISPDVKADVTALPADNPPLASGAVPTHLQMSGMSSSMGVEPTVALQLAPEAMYREHQQHFNGEEVKTEWIGARRAFLGSATWNVTSPVGTELFSFSMDSFLGLTTPGDPVPASIAYANLFMYWHSDLEFEFTVVRTNYHAGRLRAVIGYGAPSIISDEVNTYYNEIMDFSGTMDKHIFVVPWNQQTEYLRTYGGPNAADLLQNHSLGMFNVYVANQLITTSATVVSTVEILLFVRFLGLRVTCPRPLPYVYLGILPFQELIEPSEPQRKQRKARFEPQAPMDARTLPVAIADPVAQISTIETETRIAEHVAADEPRDEIGVQITNRLPVERPIPCKLNFRAKFEFCVSDIHEVARRMVVLPRGAVMRVAQFFQDPTLVDPGSGTYYRIDVKPYSFFRNFYAAWGGSLRFRIFQSAAQIGTVHFYPFITPATGDNIMIGHGLVDNWIFETPFTSTDGQYIRTAYENDTVPLAKPTEMTYSSSGGMNFIDVQVPFQTHFNFLTTSVDGTPPESTYVGFLGFTTNTTALDQPFTENNNLIYTAVGDDFEFGIWRPPPSLLFGTLSGVAPPAGTYNFMGFDQVFS